MRRVFLLMPLNLLLIIGRSVGGVTAAHLTSDNGDLLPPP